MFVNKDNPDELLYLAVLFDTDSNHWHASADLFEHFEFEEWEEWEHEKELIKSVEMNLHKFLEDFED